MESVLFALSMRAFNVIFLIATLSGNEATQQNLRQGSSGAPKTLIGAIAQKLPPDFSLATADADGNDIVTWKELYDTLATYQIPNLDTGVIKGLVEEFNKDGAKEGAEAGLDKAEFAKLVAMLKRKAANALTANPDAFEIGCYQKVDPLDHSEPGDMGFSYRGLLSNTVSGRTCQKWTEEKPHIIGIEPTEDNGLGNHNFCRNPDESEDKPWCYTVDPGQENAKEVCEVPACPQVKDYQAAADSLAIDIASNLKCHCVDQHYGSFTTTKDTAIPLNLLDFAKKQFGQVNLDVAKKRCKCPKGQIAFLLKAEDSPPKTSAGAKSVRLNSPELAAGTEDVKTHV